MIEATLTKDGEGQITELNIKNHGHGTACAAVSMLTLNTINSIEAFTEDDIACEYDENGGYLHFTVNRHDISEGTKILLKALELGLVSTKEEYPKEIRLEVKTSQQE